MSIQTSFRVILLLVALTLGYTSIYSQDNSIDHSILDAYQEGHHQSLRDVFLALGNSSSSISIEDVEKGHLFDIQDDHFKSLTADQRLAYYYHHKDQIQYYDQWQAFLRNDLAVQNLPFALLENDKNTSAYIVKARQIFDLIQEKSTKKAIAKIESLTLAETIYSKRILLEILKLTRELDISFKKKSRVYSALLPHLIVVGDQHTYQEIDALGSDSSYDQHTFQKIITEISQTHSSLITKDSLPNLLKHLSESQFTAHLKETVYSTKFNIYRSFFNNEIDYYGKLLSAIPLGQKNDENEIIHRLIASEHPKALYYIASRWFLYAKEHQQRSCELTELINAFIDHDIQVNTNDGRALKVDCSSRDLHANKSILAYWVNNYKHYEWSAELKRFVNKSLLKKDRQQLILLYKNLNKNNTALALKSYWQLIESDPILLAEVDKVYNKKLLNYNSELPSRKYNYLIQLAWLIEYCKSNNVKHTLPESLMPLINSLVETNNVKEKRKKENQIINNLTLANITAFEIWSIVNSARSDVKFSATRITNIFYQNNIELISQSDSQLFLFLKKSNLFKKFGDHGSSKYYIQKLIDNTSVSNKNLSNLRNGILDEDILSSISYVIDQQKNNSVKITTKSISDFIKSPLSFDTDAISKIENYSSKSLNRLFSLFHEKQTPSERFQSLNWINIHQPKQGIAFLVDLITHPVEVKDIDGHHIDTKNLVIQLLANYSDSKKHKDNAALSTYTQLFKKIYNTEFKQLVESESPSIANINKIIGSDFFDLNHRSAMLDLLPKVKPTRNISALKFSPKLSISELQDVLPKIDSKNALNYLLKITSTDKNDDLVSFLIEHAKSKGSSEAGKFFNNLFKKNWFSDYVDDNDTSLDIKHQIQWILTNYWEGDDILSTFEEEQTMLNIIKIELAGKSLEQKISLILNSFVDNEIKLHIIEKMIYQIDYSSIPILLDSYDQIVDIGGLELFQFITTDFGIPIEKYDNSEIIAELQYDIRNLDKKTLYHKYLERLGISITFSNGHLDIKKAYAIITEDLVRPYVGTGGSVRDEYVFSVIKILEEEFNETLGFHPKLNESQSFYKYTSKKRAEKWAEYLEKEMKDLL